MPIIILQAIYSFFFFFTLPVSNLFNPKENIPVQSDRIFKFIFILVIFRTYVTLFLGFLSKVFSKTFTSYFFLTLKFIKICMTIVLARLKNWTLNKFIVLGEFNEPRREEHVSLFYLISSILGPCKNKIEVELLIK